MCRGGESDRMSDRAEEPVRGHAVALTEASEWQPCTEQYPDNPYPHLAPRPGPCLRRGRSKARASMARKPCLLAPPGEGLCALSPRASVRW
ncbi:hypothetical protein XarjCFBP7645_09575 [Xanthomonas arboricola]|uniref:Uncharacterized protein n=1 Tax=Xanthomonas arboricola TaxID=56448 RepID=A0A2S7ADN1_9XANT|nr:hypothetical protein XarjCFBP7645_09575 [Xanthomonas arboricola]